jgi:hypothetical protein
LAISIDIVGCVAHEAARQDELAKGAKRSNCMARRQCNKLIPATNEENIQGDEQGTGVELTQGRKRSGKIAFATGMHNMNLLPDYTRGFLQIFPLRTDIRQIRIHQIRREGQHLVGCLAIGAQDGPALGR